MGAVRVGIVGMGNMGRFHAEALKKVDGVQLAAVCSRASGRAGAAGTLGVRRFGSVTDMLGAGVVDAVIVAVPHPQHAEVVTAALRAGVHVLCEKPLASTLGDARAMLEVAAGHPQLKFAVMFQMRAQGIYRKIRKLVFAGEVGELSRVTWIVTDWFRTHRYYASGGWRATWAGEGGGVLINQCPHNLDLLCWCTSLSPRRVTAVATVGKTHPIEVEDEVSAIIEFDNEAIGHFVTSTGEAPGVNRLEICGDRGRLVAEAGKLIFWRTRQSVRAVRETCDQPFATIETSPTDVPYDPTPPETHYLIHQNFVDAIRRDEPLLSPAGEALIGLELGVAMQMAGLRRRPVELPIDSAEHARFIAEMASRFAGRKTLATVDAGPADMSSSFR